MTDTPDLEVEMPTSSEQEHLREQESLEAECSAFGDSRDRLLAAPSAEVTTTSPGRSYRLMVGLCMGPVVLALVCIAFFSLPGGKSDIASRFVDVVDQNEVKGGMHDNRAIAAAQEEAEDGCAGVGASCLKSKCCKEAGMQCYTKDDWWAQCLEDCIPGPNILDQTSPMPWACNKLGDRTPGEVKACSAIGEDCSSTKCCKEGGTQCFAKDDNYATCKPACVPGPDPFDTSPDPWSCKILGPRAPGAPSWVKNTCAHQVEDCSAKGCCADPNHQCYRQTQYWAQCRETCTKGEKRNAWEQPWDCTEVGMRTPLLGESNEQTTGKVQKWVLDKCSSAGDNCLETQCCHAVGAQCYKKSDYWAACKYDCSMEPDEDNTTWSCEKLGSQSIGLSIKGYPSLYCFSLFMPSSYENGLLKSQLEANAGIFQCDGYDVFAADPADLGKSKDGIEVKAIQIPKISVGVSQDGTAGNAKLFMAVWDKIIAGGRFRNYDWTIKVDPDAVLVPWRIRDHMAPHVGKNVYVVNCNKFPGSPNFPMMYGAVEIFSSAAMLAYASGSWKCGQQLPWGGWGEDYYMTHCMDFIGVGRIGDFGVLGDNMCTGANCADGGIASFHPFKDTDSWMQCWGQATVPAN
mmetsp:Transcript_13202/g.28887  ORF Transcript_13202/g.28887 Transcript_13202/m.28887 type:complete len:629 (+) Transcript_13202:65-1951(+)